jgi:hypothetical protein
VSIGLSSSVREIFAALRSKTTSCLSLSAAKKRLRRVEWQEAGANHWPERPLLEAQRTTTVQRSDYFENPAGSTAFSIIA